MCEHLGGPWRSWQSCSDAADPYDHCHLCTVQQTDGYTTTRSPLGLGRAGRRYAVYVPSSHEYVVNGLPRPARILLRRGAGPILRGLDVAGTVTNKSLANRRQKEAPCASFSGHTALKWGHGLSTHRALGHDVDTNRGYSCSSEGTPSDGDGVTSIVPDTYSFDTRKPRTRRRRLRNLHRRNLKTL